MSDVELMRLLAVSAQRASRRAYEYCDEECNWVTQKTARHKAEQKYVQQLREIAIEEQRLRAEASRRARVMHRAFCLMYDEDATCAER